MPDLGDPIQDIQKVANNPGMASAAGGASAATNPPRAQNKADIKVAPDPWNDDLALRTVLADFYKAETFRKQNFDQRWTDNDRILHANVAQEYWEGTEPQIPKASIGVKLEQQQLESLLPYLHEGIFASSDGIWFDFFPRPGTNNDAAIASREFVAMQTDVANVEYELDGSIRSLGHHGTGIMKLGWCKKRIDRAEWSAARVANDNGIGTSTRRVRKTKTSYEQGPEVTSLNLRDLYVDPSLKEPNLQKAQFVIQRGLPGWDMLQRLAKIDKDYSIPSYEELRQYLVQNNSPKPTAADGERRQSLNEAGQQSMPVQGTTDPARARLEVLEYWTQDRFVVVLERKWTICNKKNPYGFIPFYSSNFVDVNDQFYGKGLAELLGDEQLLQQGLINSHLNEVALSIHGMIAYQSGTVTNKQELRPKPGGAICTLGKPGDAIVDIRRAPVTQDWFIALQQSQVRAQQISGLADIVTQGTPSVATSVTRTARGVGAIEGAAKSRIQFIIERIENRMIVPLLDGIIRLNQIFLNPNDTLSIVKNGQTFLFDPICITNGQFRVELRAGSKMAAKSTMQQSAPMLLQTILPLVGALREQGTKTNISNIVRDALEVWGWRNRNDWFTQMTPEEMQAMQAAEQGPAAAKMQQKQQLQDDKLDHKQQMMHEQAGLNILQDVVSKAFDGNPIAGGVLGQSLEQAGAADA